MLVWGEAAKRLQPTSVVGGVHEQLEMGPELLVGLVMVALDCRVLDGAVRPLDLTVGPRMAGLGQAMLDVVLVASTTSSMCRL